MPIISKTAQLLRYFAQQFRSRTRKGIPRTLLMKMAYMSDLLARKYLGVPITDFQYYRYKYGPYDDAIESRVVELVEAGIGDDSEQWDNDNVTKRLTVQHAADPLDFNTGELEIMRYVAEFYLLMPLKELLEDVVYRTTPMRQNVRMQEQLPMAMVDDVGTQEVGFRLIDALEAEQSIDAGRFSLELDRG